MHRLGFNGELHEPGLGWQILGNGYRVYNPVLLRFHSPDNQSPFGAGGLNAYAYCLGDPINAHDPEGHVVKWVVSQGKYSFHGVRKDLFASSKVLKLTSEAHDPSVVMAADQDISALKKLGALAEKKLVEAQSAIQELSALNGVRKEHQSNRLHYLQGKQRSRELKVARYGEAVKALEHPNSLITRQARVFLQRKARDAAEYDLWQSRSETSSSIRKQKVD